MRQTKSEEPSSSRCGVAIKDSELGAIQQSSAGSASTVIEISDTGTRERRKYVGSIATLLTGLRLCGLAHGVSAGRSLALHFLAKFCA